MVKKRKKKTKPKPSKGWLVKGFIPPVPRSLLEFESFKEEVKDMLRHNSGVYALYDKKRLYYVGLTGDLFKRLYRHTRDRHKNKWDQFSVFVISRSRYLKDIESMIHRISEPPANLWRGKFPSHYLYDRKIKRMVKETFRKITKIQKGFAK